MLIWTPANTLIASATPALMSVARICVFRSRMAPERRTGSMHGVGLLASVPHQKRHVPSGGGFHCLDVTIDRTPLFTSSFSPHSDSIRPTDDLLVLEHSAISSIVIAPFAPFNIRTISRVYSLVHLPRFISLIIRTIARLASHSSRYTGSISRFSISPAFGPPPIAPQYDTITFLIGSIMRQKDLAPSFMHHFPPPAHVLAGRCQPPRISRSF
jgi:hypothetical protein